MLKKRSLSPLLAASCLAGLTFSAQHADASFHLYDFQEIYTNPTGNIQFIELTTTANSQQFLSGHQIYVEDFANGNAQIAEFVFPTNGPSPTANTTLLIATNDFATTYSITPDFILPDNFLSSNADYRLNFDGQDFLSLSALPTDGVMSLDGFANLPNNQNQFGINANATPMNFAGDTTTIVPEPSAVLLGFCSMFGMALRRR